MMATSIIITHYTVEEAMKLLNVKTRSVFYRNMSQFDSIKVINKRYIPKVQVERVLQGLPARELSIKETNA